MTAVHMTAVHCYPQRVNIRVRDRLQDLQAAAKANEPAKPSVSTHYTTLDVTLTGSSGV
jgi:histidinol phosphatase-like enzyme